VYGRMGKTKGFIKTLALGGGMGGWLGGGMDANICIACLRQVVAFAPKVIIIACLRQVVAFATKVIIIACLRQVVAFAPHV
jgi:hypothetical protein